MSREEEVILLLKDLLGQAAKGIDSNQYSRSREKIIKSSKELITISVEINRYLGEIDENI